MKRLLLSVALATSLAFSSCQFDDSGIWDKFSKIEESIRDHEQRISALEELCKQMNTNIEALQTIVAALEQRDYVTNVSEVRSNGEVIGYTISFAYSDTVTIYHGKDGKNGADGKDGANGKDGYTPQIGVMKDTDGIYYWTLDGEWLLDGKGNKIQANGVNGTNGSNGTNGTDGVDGITPCLKIENDYWFVSYDNGVTWQQLGKATGEDGTDGNDGIDGEDGDSIFKSVTQDDEYVYFNLADGTMITLPKHDKENIQFEDLRVKAICVANWDTNNDGELSYEEAAAVTDIGDTFTENSTILAFSELKYFTGISEIPDRAFEKCYSLFKITIPQNVKSIGVYAFGQCNNLGNIIIPNSVTTIYSFAFSLSGLKTISIPDSVTSMEESAFLDCDSLTETIIGDNVTAICSLVFADCHNLVSATIGHNVSHIETGAFRNCRSLKTIYCKSKTPPAIYYDNRDTYKHALPLNSEMKIYVPRSLYDNYMQYSGSTGGTIKPQNWYQYQSYIEPYDFE